jgi:hypothetical protein
MTSLAVILVGVPEAPDAASNKRVHRPEPAQVLSKTRPTWPPVQRRDPR